MMIRPPHPVPRPRLPATKDGAVDAGGGGPFSDAAVAGRGIAPPEQRRAPLRLRSGRGWPLSASPKSLARGAFFSGEGGCSRAAVSYLMIGPLVPPALRLTAATLRNRAAGAGGSSWPSQLPPSTDHRRAPLRLRSCRGPPLAPGHRHRPGGRFFRRGRAQVGRGGDPGDESPPLPHHLSPRPQLSGTGGVAAGAGGRFCPSGSPAEEHRRGLLRLRGRPFRLLPEPPGW